MTTDAFRWRPEDDLGPMHPRVNAQVRAADRAEALTAKAWARAARVAKVLFDPALVPDMAKRPTLPPTISTGALVSTVTCITPPMTPSTTHMRCMSRA